MVGDYYYGTGRRKSAVARVFLKPGKGGFVVNGKPIDEFFARETGRIAPGLRANLVAADDRLKVLETWIDGRSSQENSA